MCYGRRFQAIGCRRSRSYRRVSICKMRMSPSFMQKTAVSFKGIGGRPHTSSSPSGSGEWSRRPWSRAGRPRSGLRRSTHALWRTQEEPRARGLPNQLRSQASCGRACEVLTRQLRQGSADADPRGGCLHLGTAHCGRQEDISPSSSWLPGAPPLAAMAGHHRNCGHGFDIGSRMNVV